MKITGAQALIRSLEQRAGDDPALARGVDLDGVLDDLCREPVARALHLKCLRDVELTCQALQRAVPMRDDDLIAGPQQVESLPHAR